MTTTRWMLGIVVLVGCSAQPSSTQMKPTSLAAHDPSEHHGGDPRVTEIVAKAERALTDSMRLDYRRPFVREPVDREPIRALFFAACRAGDHRSCWMASNVANRAPNYSDAYEVEAQALVRSHCLSGDMMSCRAINRTSDSPDDDPSHSFLIGACLKDHTRCDFDGMRQECRAGFVDNCYFVAHWQPNAVDLPELVTACVQIARESCSVGITPYCEVLNSLLELAGHASRDDQLLIAERRCVIELNDCNKLGALYQSTDPVKARDAYERNCQLADYFDEPGMACEQTWRAYTDPKSGIVEPVPGRANQLRDWACTQHHDCW